ncbi:dihydroxyacetone kinase subunit DhaK [Candidatus Sodalis endolongispinus]|uniref:Dihydroxyacetone kinase subunit DhaK n=1 Tax=Candidatus Sodalis endolongispinus TaxID=2812662 RepID=A0ABS5YAI9_9GAMM|nr:dihydroxyacetone kinase subunit DhaK [Candidatus Sodalis endolongispinus]MBT9431989.1 dihydroxyacetone kinase subunit DhaK [Candidatus Sodalis endolongispinus]
MQRLLNDPDRVVDDMLDGFLRVHAESVQRCDENPRVITRTSAAQPPGKVGLVTGGGSGHEPAFLGYLGEGMLDAVAVGEVFSSPTANAFLAAIRAADQGQGVACLFGNYAGDSMNVQMAIAMAEDEHRRVRIVKARDDIASAPHQDAEKRHGIAGGVFMLKTAGALAQQGGTLEQVIQLADKTAQRTRSICVGLSPCVIPAVGKPNFTIAPGTYEFGIGHHGEAGQRVAPLENAQDIARQMVDALREDFGLQAEKGAFAMMVSGLGTTPLMEQYLMAGHIVDELTGHGAQVWRLYVGDYVTSLDMNGLCLTLLLLDDELKRFLTLPAAPLGLGLGLASL